MTQDAGLEALITLAILAIPAAIGLLHGHVAQNRLHKALRPDETWRVR